MYAYDQDAVRVTHDMEFSMRRRKNVVGRHIFLRCNEWDGITVRKQHLDATLPALGRHRDLWIKLSLGTEREYSHDWK